MQKCVILTIAERLSVKNTLKGKCNKLFTKNKGKRNF